MVQKSRATIIKAIAAAGATVALYMTRETWLTVLKISLLASSFSFPLIPLCNRIEKRGIRRGAAALISIFALIVVLVFFLLVFVPYLVSSIMDFLQRMLPLLLSSLDQLYALLNKLGINASFQFDPSKLLLSSLSPISSGLARGGAAIVSAIGQLLISLVISYYLLTIRDTIGRHLLLFLPFRYRKAFLSALSGCRNAALGYLAGIIKTSLFVSAATMIGLLLLGVRDALILSLFMGILEVLPYFGPFLGAIPILIATVPMGIAKSALALCLVLLVQQIESGIVGPYFTASSTSVHPLTAIVSAFIGGSLFGIPGILLTLPLLIVLRSMWWSLQSTSFQF